MAGHGRLRTRKPPSFGPHGGPALCTTSGGIPGSGRVAQPGLVDVAPGSGEIMIEPVSVCHHVSTIGQRSSPIALRYHIHASGLIGSPTEPSSRSDDRSEPAGHLSAHLTNAPIPVGAG